MPGFDGTLLPPRKPVSRELRRPGGSVARDVSESQSSCAPLTERSLSGSGCGQRGFGSPRSREPESVYKPSKLAGPDNAGLMQILLDPLYCLSFVAMIQMLTHSARPGVMRLVSATWTIRRLRRRWCR